MGSIFLGFALQWQSCVIDRICAGGVHTPGMIGSCAVKTFTTKPNIILPPEVKDQEKQNIFSHK